MSRLPTALLIGACFIGTVICQRAEHLLAQNPCSSKTTCSDCIRTPSCAWCFAADFNGPRCFNPAMEGGTGGCDEAYIFNPDNQRSIDPLYNKELSRAIGRMGIGMGSSSYEETMSAKTGGFGAGGGSAGAAAGGDNLVQLKPQRVKLQLRMNEMQKLTFAYSQAQDYPVDLYYLMDLSRSMKNDKEKLSTLGSLLLISPCDGCAAPYGFKNQMSLSNDTDYFDQAVAKADVSGNLDAPEGGFDAIMQAVVCKGQIGWRDQARRLLVFSTDAGFHYAGDGKLGGIVQPNDGECHMEDNSYTHSTLQDYPSISQINLKVKQHAINVIFAVTSEQISVYEELSKNIEGSSSGVLSEDSGNVVELVREQYNISKMAENPNNAGPSGSQGRLLPCYPCTVTPGGTVRVEDSSTLYHITDSGGTRPWRPVSTPRMATPSERRKRASARSTVGGLPSKCRRSLHLTEDDITNVLNDSGSDDDASNDEDFRDDEPDVVDFVFFRERARKLRNCVVMDDPQDGCVLNEEGDVSMNVSVQCERLVEERIDENMDVVHECDDDVRGQAASDERSVSDNLRGQAASDERSVSDNLRGQAASDERSVSDNLRGQAASDERSKITSTVEMKDTSSDAVQIVYYSSCLGGKEPIQTNKCDGLKVGDIVTFTAEITLKECPKDPKNWKQSFQIYPVGISENLMVEVEMICDCPCEHPGHHAYDDSPLVCSGQGISACGVCLCNPGRFGKGCECSAHGGVSLEQERGCRPTNATFGPLCSNRGTSEMANVYVDSACAMWMTSITILERIVKSVRRGPLYHPDEVEGNRCLNCSLFPIIVEGKLEGVHSGHSAGCYRGYSSGRVGAPDAVEDGHHNT
ncbi:unnamed protein product [Diatraea saccharalis]|uniref:Integrin beta n=1 Tax=Diatraea saccharalis TaxID=40085 RepID=A0A9N9QUP0_9NEOP|nr:unnamed protein product [Diatraea saccharalis]